MAVRATCGSPAARKSVADGLPAAADLGKNPARTGGRGSDCVLGEVPGHGPELLHGSGDTELRLSG